MSKPAPTVVPRLWPNSTVVCIASGPSLTQEDVEYVRGKAKVIVVNDNYKLAPWADVLYACDAKWWQWHKGVPSFTGLKYSLQVGGPRLYPDVQVLKRGPHEGLSLDPTSLCLGNNSGYQAINLAVHFGAARIVLLGYDMQRTGGKEHWFGEHPHRTSQSLYQMFCRRFATLVEPLQAIHVDIVNCTRETALTCFPRKPLRETLSAHDTVAA